MRDGAAREPDRPGRRADRAAGAQVARRSHRHRHARPARPEAAGDGQRRRADRAQRAGAGDAGAASVNPQGTQMGKLEGKIALDPRTRALLEAPIAPTLLRLAVPNMLVLVAQAAAGLIETYFIGKLGTDALAGVALVFPLVMLMQMMSAGAMGGGISSSIARALGGARRADADALALHALVIALGFGLAFTLALLIGGRALYQAMGGRDASLAAALTYSNWVFAGAVLVWLFNSLASVIRGTGNMALPAAVICIGALIVIPASPVLIFGWGPFPRLGIVGGALALIAYYALGSIALGAYLWSGRSVVRPSLRTVQFR